MSKSNHQKHEFAVIPREYKRLGFVSAKGLMGQIKKQARYNGKSIREVIGDEVGKTESFRIYGGTWKE